MAEFDPHADAFSGQSGPVVVHANWYEFRAGQVIEHDLVGSRTMIWAVRGQGQLTVNGVERELNADTFVVTPWRHRIRYAADRMAPFVLGAIHLVPQLTGGVVEFRAAHGVNDPLAADPRRNDAPELFGSNGLLSGKLSRSPRLAALATYVVHRFVDIAAVEKDMQSLAALLIDEISMEVQPRPLSPDRPSPALASMQRGVLTHLDRPLSIADVAAFAGVSTSTAERLFARYAGTSVARWVLRARVERAQYLLRSSQLPVGAVARAVGFSDQYHFSRTFSRLVGTPPTRFRHDSTAS